MKEHRHQVEIEHLQESLRLALKSADTYKALYHQAEADHLKMTEQNLRSVKGSEDKSYTRIGFIRDTALERAGLLFFTEIGIHSTEDIYFNVPVYLRRD